MATESYHEALDRLWPAWRTCLMDGGNIKFRDRWQMMSVMEVAYASGSAGALPTSDLYSRAGTVTAPAPAREVSIGAAEEAELRRHLAAHRESFFAPRLLDGFCCVLSKTCSTRVGVRLLLDRLFTRLEAGPQVFGDVLQTVEGMARARKEVGGWKSAEHVMWQLLRLKLPEHQLGRFAREPWFPAPRHGWSLRRHGVRPFLSRVALESFVVEAASHVVAAPAADRPRVGQWLADRMPWDRLLKAVPLEQTPKWKAGGSAAWFASMWQSVCRVACELAEPTARAVASGAPSASSQRDRPPRHPSREDEEAKELADFCRRLEDRRLHDAARREEALAEALRRYGFAGASLREPSACSFGLPVEVVMRESPGRQHGLFVLQQPMGAPAMLDRIVDFAETVGLYRTHDLVLQDGRFAWLAAHVAPEECGGHPTAVIADYDFFTLMPSQNYKAGSAPADRELIVITGDPRAIHAAQHMLAPIATACHPL